MFHLLDDKSNIAKADLVQSNQKGQQFGGGSVYVDKRD